LEEEYERVLMFDVHVNAHVNYVSSQLPFNLYLVNEKQTRHFDCATFNFDVVVFH
jgi:hypothetical protein